MPNMQRNICIKAIKWEMAFYHKSWCIRKQRKALLEIQWKSRAWTRLVHTVQLAMLTGVALHHVHYFSFWGYLTQKRLKSLYALDVDMSLSPILKEKNGTRVIIGTVLSLQQYANLFRKDNKSTGVSGKWIKILRGFAKHRFVSLLVVE